MNTMNYWLTLWYIHISISRRCSVVHIWQQTHTHSLIGEMRNNEKAGLVEKFNVRLTEQQEKKMAWERKRENLLRNQLFLYSAPVSEWNDNKRLLWLFRLIMGCTITIFFSSFLSLSFSFLSPTLSFPLGKLILSQPFSDLLNRRDNKKYHKSPQEYSPFFCSLSIVCDHIHTLPSINDTTTVQWFISAGDVKIITWHDGD